MKSPLLTGLLLLAAGATVHAQFSILPQAGIEKSRGTLQYNNRSVSGINANLRAGLRVDYRFKGGHGPLINLATSPAPINFAFNNEGGLLRQESSSGNKLQFRMEAGYQYTSKPIQLRKSKAAPVALRRNPPQATGMQKKTCGASYYRSHCAAGKKDRQNKPANKALNMRLQPSLALAYVPSARNLYTQSASGFEYTANNWKTAIVPALAFEFGSGNRRLLTITAFYTKPMATKEAIVTTYSGSKPVITNVSSRSATWGLTAGIPFSLGKKQVSVPKTVSREVKPVTYKTCTRSYSRCN